MATVIAYVDGFNLYHGLHQAYGRRYLALSLAVHDHCRDIDRAEVCCDCVPNQRS